MYRSLFFLVLSIVFSIISYNNAFAACSGASPTWRAENASYEEVNACVSAASSGDTINVPTGTYSWGANTIATNKALIIIGAGADKTIIDGTGMLFNIDTGSNIHFPFRLSGFRLITTGSTIVQLYNAGYGWRIDHNYMERATPKAFLEILANGSTWTIFGLIDNNVFKRVTVDSGGGTTAANHSWTSAAQWGTANAIFVENNIFYMHEEGNTTFNNSVDSNNGARMVFRYNTFNDAYIMAHSACQSSVRGTRSYEIYNNRFNRTIDNYATSYLVLRAGSFIIANNVVSGGWAPWLSSKGAVTMDNRRSWFDSSCSSGFGNSDGTSAYDGNATNTYHSSAIDGWPSLDQIGRGTGAIGSQASDPAYIWNNASGNICVGGANKYTSCASDSDCPGSTCSTQNNNPNAVVLINNSNNQPYHIVANRDYYSGTARSGWSAYTCPHPLAGSGSCNTSAAGNEGYIVNNVSTPAPSTTYYALSTSVSGSGAITSSPSGISCGSTCSANYESDTAVTLTATANSGYTFAGWSGACSGTGSCVVSMTAAKTVSATFSQNAVYHTLTTSKTGNGSLVSTPSGINCGATCAYSYESSTTVTITATADTGYTFTGWSGACTGTGACTISMDAEKAVSATFTKNAIYYTLSTNNTGGGTITGSPSGINCGATCSYSYDENTSVTLTAAAYSGYTFSGWSGACTGTGSCVVSMTAAKTVSATFTKNATYYTLTTNNSGGGKITSSPSGISCGATCAYSFTSGTSVTLTVTPSYAYRFAGWSGACTGKNACTVTMDTAKTVKASFTLRSRTKALAVAKVGRGTIRSKAATLVASALSTNTGIDCGDNCVEEYSSDTKVTLTARADAGYTFAGWSGACSGTGECTVTVTDSSDVTANFNASAGSDSGSDSGSGGGCFIATAAYGSYLDPHVMVLREFRDKVLLKNYVGRLFVKFYYKNSPAIAHSIAQNDALRVAMRLTLTPFIYAVAYPGAAAMILLTAALIAMITRRKRLARFEI